MRMTIYLSTKYLVNIRPKDNVQFNRTEEEWKCEKTEAGHSTSSSVQIGCNKMKTLSTSCMFTWRIV